MDKNKNPTIEQTFKLAVKNHQEGKTDIAKKLYNQVLKINPENSSVHNNLGFLFTELRDYEKAKSYFEKAIELDPLNKKYMVGYGYILLRLNDKLKGYEYIDKVEGVIKFTPTYYKII